MSKERYGTGTITAAGQKDGRKRWRIRAYVGQDPDDTSKTRQVERVVYGTERAAKRQLADLVKDVKDGKVGQTGRAKGSGRTIAGLFDEWLVFVKANKAPNTYVGYRARIENRLKPALGDVKVDRIDVHQLDRYFNDLRAKGLRASTIKQDYITLSAALSQALKWGWTTSNPARSVTLPRDDEDVEDGPALTAEQIGTLYAEAVKDEAADLAMAIALGAATGLRRGELLGLQWGDVDWQQGSIRVARQRTPGTTGGDDTRPLKYKKRGQTRTAWPGPGVLALLERHYDDKRAVLGAKPADEAWVLSYDGRTPIASSSISEHFRLIAQRAGVRGSLHSLRHFASTQIQADGADLATTAALMGNTTAVLSQTYLHAADDRSAVAGSAHGARVVAALAPAPADL